ncbi:ESF1 homolog [Anoplophora glabripennis]|uniref:ESF1 homolog n=1 Tax=Anoplophora glabripennis TaxID=217634 RepID=UPI00087580D6|nr:ESF1 homolog [Anoplophora glabripennis]
MEDQRFAHIANDPKFRRIPKKQQKVKIDKRFQSMFKDQKFKVKYSTDKRGRPVSHTSTENLKRYYDLSSEEESSSSDSEDNEKQNSESEVGKFVKAPKSDAFSELEKKDKSDKIVSDVLKHKLQNLNVDYARGESTLCSESSSDDDESEDELSETDEIEHKWGELDADAEETEGTTYRLAACNMDWDRIRAIDLMVLFNSFLPPGGVIKSVAIYPSEFGKKRMAEEEIKGPIELVESKVEENDNENEEGSSYHMEKLRQYQLNRLKYYYAVISFDTPNSANKIYTECDGKEYESSATKIDLRFIPDSMEFDDEPKEMCDKLPDVNRYQPRFFTTTALQQAKVDLTWDETNPERLEIAEKLKNGKVDGISDADLQNYLASSSGEEETEDEEEEKIQEESGGSSIDKYKALLQDIEKKEKSKNRKDMEMEISWGIDLKQKTEKLIKENMSKGDEKSPFEQYLKKRREKKREKREQKKHSKDSDDSESDIPSDIDMNDKYFAEEFDNPEFKKKKKHTKKSEDPDVDDQKQAELELLMNEDDGKQHFSLKKIQQGEDESKNKKKNKKVMDKNDKRNDDFEINVADDRFSALFTSHHFNIDPTDPHYKKTKGMEVLINEKLKRRNNDSVDINKKPKMESKKNVELNLLVKSVKRKVNTFKSK